MYLLKASGCMVTVTLLFLKLREKWKEQQILTREIVQVG